MKVVIIMLNYIKVINLLNSGFRKISIWHLGKKDFESFRRLLFLLSHNFSKRL